MEQVQHFTFTLTDGEGKYRFGFCRFPPSADVCLCIIRYSIVYFILINITIASLSL